MVGTLFFLIYTANTNTQNQARADIKNAEGKTLGTASLREIKDGVVLTVNVEGLPQGSMLFIFTRSESAKVLPLRAPDPILIR